MDKVEETIALSLTTTAAPEAGAEAIGGQILDRMEIRELIENWVVWRDADMTSRRPTSRVAG